jgi:multiple sugar transport system ATP-binding protein
MTNIVFKNITKQYLPMTRKDKTVKAVDNFNLDIHDGEFVILVGPSGCGKTTTLRMIAGLEEITAGEIEINGKVINRVHPKDRDIAMVFQNYALYPHMTVFENMAFSLKLRHMPKAEIRKKVNEAAEILNITHLLTESPKPCPADSGRGWPWEEPSCAIPPYS